MKNYCFTAKVIEGQKLGRKLGIPTANFDPKLFPTSIKTGVYSAIVTHDKQEHLAILFFGPKKTFKEVKNVLEVHILDFNQEIYGETLGVCLKKFIRGDFKFSSAEALVEQIEKDILVARKSS